MVIFQIFMEALVLNPSSNFTPGFRTFFCTVYSTTSPQLGTGGQYFQVLRRVGLSQFRTWKKILRYAQDDRGEALRMTD